MYYCTNAACPAQLQEHLKHFASRSAMDIRGIGESMAATLIREKVVKRGESYEPVQDVGDIYSIDKVKLAALERLGEKSSSKLLDQIENSKDRPLARLLLALGIRHIGEEMAERLVKQFPSIDALEKASRDDLMSVPTIGPKIADSVISFFKLERNRLIVDKLRKAKVNIEQKVKKTQGLPLEGLEFVLTGKLLSFSREEAEERIRSLGGSAKGDVTKKTDYLVVGEDPGLKVARAQSLGIKQIGETDLVKILKQENE
jgi:DNA ligase (NAD+)